MAIGKNRQRFCIVGKYISRESFEKDPDHDRHAHIGWKELRDLHDQNFLQPIAATLGTKDISFGREENSPDFIFEWLTGSAIRFKRHVPTRGLSSKFGAYLAAALKRKEAWAEVLVEIIREGGSFDSPMNPISSGGYDGSWDNSVKAMENF